MKKWYLINEGRCANVVMYNNVQIYPEFTLFYDIVS